MRTGSGKRYAEPSPSTRCGEKPAIVPRSHSSRTGSSCSCQLALGGGGESPVMRWRLPSLYMRITGDLPSVKFLDHRLHLLPQQLVPTSASRDPGRSIHAFTYHTHTHTHTHTQKPCCRGCHSLLLVLQLPSKTEGSQSQVEQGL